MNLYDIIQTTNTVFWLALGIRQFKGKWGWFFLILGLTDIISLAGYQLIHLPVTYFYPMSFTLQIVALYHIFFEKHKFVLLPISILLLIPGIYLSNELVSSSVSLFSLFIFSFFIREFIVELFRKKNINLFLITFSTYLFINVLKIIMLRIKEWDAVDLFYMASIFQSIIMIPFLFIRHDDERLSIQLRKKETV